MLAPSAGANARCEDARRLGLKRRLAISRLGTFENVMPPWKAAQASSPTRKELRTRALSCLLCSTVTSGPYSDVELLALLYRRHFLFFFFF